VSLYNYFEATSRNIGWLARDEQALLRGKRVAIAGVGGVGGFHLVELARLGVGAFTIADPDTFELANFNRQTGATMSTLNAPKAHAMAQAAQQINPELDLRVFADFINEHNVDEFLRDVDVYVDGLDFFAFDARRLVFTRCRERGIPVVTAAPLGMGVSALVFTANSMSAEDYFGFNATPRERWPLQFLIGLAPAMLHRTYLVDRSTVDFAKQRGPSTVIACYLCAGVAAALTLKLLLGRGDVPVAPRGFQFDAYRNKMAHTWRPWGFKNPLQRIATLIAMRQLRKLSPTDD
jgi:hypothetical protein